MVKEKEKEKVPITSTNVKMKLSVKERLSIPTLFPETGDLNGIRIMADIRTKTQLTQEEIEKLNMKINPRTGGTSWTPEADLEVGKKQVSFTSLEFGFIKDRIEALGNEKKLTEEQLPLIENIKGVKDEEK